MPRGLGESQDWDHYCEKFSFEGLTGPRFPCSRASLFPSCPGRCTSLGNDVRTWMRDSLVRAGILTTSYDACTVVKVKDLLP